MSSISRRFLKSIIKHRWRSERLYKHRVKIVELLYESERSVKNVQQRAEKYSRWGHSQENIDMVREK